MSDITASIKNKNEIKIILNLKKKKKNLPYITDRERKREIGRIEHAKMK